MARSINVSLDDLKTLPKNQLKKLIKSKLDERMVNVFNSTIPRMTKLRFMEKPATFKRKLYVTLMRGKETIQVLRIRLNMITVYDNYHGDITMRRTCPHCEEVDDTTEHLIECPILHSSLTSDLIKQCSNIETWRQILEIVCYNMDHRLETCSWTRK